MIAALVVAMWLALAQDRPAPLPAAATGSISGSVVNDVGTPVRHAVVSLAASEIGYRASVLSDDEGRFEIANLPAGAYTVTTTKAAHVPSTYGALRPGARGRSIVLNEGQTQSGVTVTLPRGAVITGVVRDVDGEPAAGVGVMALSTAALRPDGPTFRPGPIRTDDRGAYRIFGLPPGEYVVVATPEAVGAGGMSRLSVEQLDGALGGVSLPGDALSPNRAVTYASIYYPATVQVSQAVRLALAAGDERGGIDIGLQLVPTAVLTGRLIWAEGWPKSGFRFSIFDENPRIEQVGRDRAGPVFQPDGTFRYAGINPGNYTLVATSLDGRFWARATATINSGDVVDVMLTMRPSTVVSGRIVVDPQSGPPPDLRTARLAFALLKPLLSGLGTMVAEGSAVDIQSFRDPPDATGIFVRRLLPGRYALTVPISSPWWARSATLNGRDLLDEDVEIGEQDLTGLTVTISDRHSELTGRLTRNDNRPVSHYTVVVFPSDRRFWRPGRRVTSTRLRNDATFSIRDLPGGEYLLAAVPDFDPGDLTDGSAFEPLAAQAVTVAVRDGEKTVQDVRIQ